MTGYADIIERLEKATRPSEELDANIRCALLAPDGAYVRQSEINGRWCIYFGERGGRPNLFEPDRLRHVPHDLWRGAYTASLDAAIALVEAKLPGWGWRVATCHLSDDAFVFPDFNCPERGKQLRADFPEVVNGVEWAAYTDVDLRPAGRPAIALLISMFTALEGIDWLKSQEPKP